MVSALEIARSRQARRFGTTIRSSLKNSARRAQLQQHGHPSKPDPLSALIVSIISADDCLLGRHQAF